MDSLDAQCLVIELMDTAVAAAPDQWQHLPDATLAYRFGQSTNTYSWPPHAVAEMATRWRASGRPVPVRLVDLVAGHRALAARADAPELGPPDRVI